MIERVTEIIFNVYEAFTVAVFLKEEEGLRCINVLTFSKHFDKEKILSIDDTLPGWTWKHGEVLIMPNFERDESTLGYYREKEDIKSFLGCPIEKKGVFVIDSKKRWSFSDKEKRMLPGISTLFSEVLEEEKKMTEIEEKVNLLQRSRSMLSLFKDDFSEKQILEEGCMVLGAEMSFILLERGGDLFIKEVCGHPLYLKGKRCSKESIAYNTFTKATELVLPWRSTYLKKRPLFFPEEGIIPSQAFLFPLKVSEANLGILVFASEKEPLTEDTIDILREISVLFSFYYKSMLMDEYVKKLENLDPLTKDYHFTFFLHVADEMTKKEPQLSLLSINIKGLKTLNEVLGFRPTNELLRKSAGIIKYFCGRDAIITRKHGGHFYVILRERKKLKEIIDDLKTNVSKIIEKELPAFKEELVDCGFSFYPEDGRNIFELMDKAEKHMKGGKDGVS